MASRAAEVVAGSGFIRILPRTVPRFFNPEFFLMNAVSLLLRFITGIPVALQRGYAPPHFFHPPRTARRGGPPRPSSRGSQRQGRLWRSRKECGAFPVH